MAGDFVGNLTQNNVQQAQGGTFSGLENYFFPREIELSLFGQIDPYARAGKRSGAWMNAYRTQERFRGEITTIVSNNSNFIKGIDKEGNPLGRNEPA